MHHTPTSVVEKPKPTARARSRSAPAQPASTKRKAASKSPGILADTTEVPDTVTPIGPLATTPFKEKKPRVKKDKDAAQKKVA
jgi:hypothetical protein